VDEVDSKSAHAKPAVVRQIVVHHIKRISFSLAEVLRFGIDLMPLAHSPDITATLKVTVQPGRAAVFLDDKYVGHASELGGAVHSLLISPGKHRIKVELPGYRSFKTEVNLLPGQKSELKTELVKGSIEQDSPAIKPLQ
jgi:hypothetical protein